MEWGLFIRQPNLLHHKKHWNNSVPRTRLQCNKTTCDMFLVASSTWCQQLVNMHGLFNLTEEVTNGTSWNVSPYPYSTHTDIQWPLSNQYHAVMHGGGMHFLNYSCSCSVNSSLNVCHLAILRYVETAFWDDQMHLACRHGVTYTQSISYRSVSWWVSLRPTQYTSLPSTKPAKCHMRRETTI